MATCKFKPDVVSRIDLCLLHVISVITFSLFAVTPSDAKTLIVLGDSLSAAYGLQQKQGWVAMLDERLQDDGINIINLSISGETSSGALTRLPHYLQHRYIDYAIIELGINDAFARAPTRSIWNNLAQIIQMLQAINTKVLLVQMQLTYFGETSYTYNFRRIYQDLAQKYKLDLAPFLLRDVIDNSELMIDEIHPNEKGQVLVMQSLWPSIQKFLEINP